MAEFLAALKSVVARLAWGTVADWVLAALTLLLAFIAVFQDQLRRLVARPRLSVRIQNARPDCVAYPFLDLVGRPVGASLHVRLWVKNEGNSAAQNVEVYAHRVYKWTSTGEWEQVRHFIPMNLNWSDLEPKTVYFPLIAPLMGKHCNLGYAGPNPKDVGSAVFTFLTILQPSNLGNIVEPGRYRVDLRVAAANAKPIRRAVEFHLRGPWYPDEAEMLEKGFQVSVAPR